MAAHVAKVPYKLLTEANKMMDVLKVNMRMLQISSNLPTHASHFIPKERKWRRRTEGERARARPDEETFRRTALAIDHAARDLAAKSHTLRYLNKNWHTWCQDGRLYIIQRTAFQPCPFEFRKLGHVTQNLTSRRNSNAALQQHCGRVREPRVVLI